MNRKNYKVKKEMRERNERINFKKLEYLEKQNDSYVCLEFCESKR